MPELDGAGEEEGGGVLQQLVHDLLVQNTHTNFSWVGTEKGKYLFLIPIREKVFKEDHAGPPPSRKVSH